MYCRGSEVGYRGFSPKSTQKSKNPLYNTHRWNLGKVVSNFPENQSINLGGVVFPNFPDFSSVLCQNSRGGLVLGDF